MDRLKTSDKTYKTKRIADMVGISPSTVRKYSQVLESAGYMFIKKKNGERLFTDKDVETLEQIRESSQKSTLSIKRIVKEKIIVSSVIKEKEEQQTILAPGILKDSLVTRTILLQHENRTAEIIKSLSKVDQLLQENRELKEELNQIKDFLEVDIKRKIEREQKLLEVLNELEKVIKELAISKEKKNFFEKFF